MLRTLKILVTTLLALFVLFSCREPDQPIVRTTGEVLIPRTQDTNSAEDSQNPEGGTIEEETVLPLVNPGKQFNIMTLLDRNLDLEQSDEQVLVVRPQNNDGPMQLMIASTNPIRNQYDVVWKAPLNAQNLTGITLQAEDLTGNNRDDLVVAGFDENGLHVTEIFAVPKTAGVEGFRKVFAQKVSGNIDVNSVTRSPAYHNGSAAGEAYLIIVQQKDPESSTGLDVLETRWIWDEASFIYRQGPTRSVQGQTILEKRLREVFTGGVDGYEAYLAGAWYRESGEGSPSDMVFFNPEFREITFYDGSVQETFNWGQSYRTTAQRLYTRVTNGVIKSMRDRVWLSARSWDQIDLARDRPLPNVESYWNGTYRRLGPVLQEMLVQDIEMPGLLNNQELTGTWRSAGGTEILFDLPKVIWKNGNDWRTGTASLFNLAGATVFQIQFMKKNGDEEETVNWIITYEEDRDETRVIRSIALEPVQLMAEGLRYGGEDSQRFEQIEVLSVSQ
ncbi:MAG: pallilysin-related adhesin [Spirochaetales bacterium]|nr:pallilysin-related adhesin [Spirochaetales bacterium]